MIPSVVAQKGTPGCKEANWGALFFSIQYRIEAPLSENGTSSADMTSAWAFSAESIMEKERASDEYFDDEERESICLINELYFLMRLLQTYVASRAESITDKLAKEAKNVAQENLDHFRLGEESGKHEALQLNSSNAARR